MDQLDLFATPKNQNEPIKINIRGVKLDVPKQ